MSETPPLVRMAWLQGMMSHRCITQNQAVALHQRACQAVQVPYHPQSYSDMLQEVKDSISAVGLEIRGLVDETTGANLLALVNAKSDTLAQGATAYSSQEIIYIKRLIKAIFTAPDEAYSVSSMKALSESSFVKPHMTKRACEELLASLVRHDWVEKSRTGHYSLTTRTILELQSYLKNEYPDYVLECTQCMDIITKGFACSTPDCDGRFHIHCNKVAGSSPSRKCPKCKESWDPLPIGEGSIGSNRKPNPEEEEEEEVQPDVSTQSKKKAAASSNRKASGSSSKPRRKSRNDEEEEEEEDEEMDQDDEEDQQPAPSRKTATTSRKSGRNSSGVRVAGGYVQRNDEPGSESEEDDDEE